MFQCLGGQKRVSSSVELELVLRGKHRFSGSRARTLRADQSPAPYFLIFKYYNQHFQILQLRHLWERAGGLYSFYGWGSETVRDVAFTVILFSCF